MTTPIRYSDTELLEFKLIIDQKKEKAEADLKELKESVFNHNGTEDTSPTFKPLEEGANVNAKEESSRMIQRQTKFIQDLELALVRVANKTYGICRQTGELIPKDRLRAVPHATLSIEAKEKQYEKPKPKYQPQSFSGNQTRR